MLKAEHSISKKVTTTYQWSPNLKAAINTLTYWKIRLSQLKGKVISQHSLSKIFQHTKLSTALTRSLSLEEVVGYIREARATLKDIQKNHVELQSKHLEELANAIITFWRPALLDPGKEKEYEKKKQQEIRRIMRREAFICVHKKIGYILKPNLTNGGLSQVDVPYHSTGAPYPLGPDPKSWNGPWVSLNSPKDIAEHVCAANTRQYHQAHCTPCGKEPLSSFLGYKVDKPGALAVIQGDPLPDEVRSCILPETESIFQTLQDLACRKISPISQQITPDQFKSCYKAMDERTSSSPSGRHLGHYKAATLSEDLTKLHSIMMSVLLLAGFSPTRWQQIIDVMLEKKAGDHRIHRLRIVALQESDFNQTNRLAIGRPLQKLVEDIGLAPDMQHGSRASKLCHSAVLNKQLTFEIHRHQKKPLAYIENDAVG